MHTKRNDKAVVVSVSDSGVGISKDNETNEYRPIDNNSRNAGRKRHRLRMLICKEFIDKHHGEIWAESDLKNGTTLAFFIPVA